MKKALLLVLMLGGTAWANYTYMPVNEQDAILEVNSAVQWCHNLTARKIAQDRGAVFKDIVTQEDVDAACHDRLPTAEANLKNKVWLKAR